MPIPLTSFPPPQRLKSHAPQCRDIEGGLDVLVHPHYSVFDGLENACVGNRPIAGRVVVPAAGLNLTNEHPILVELLARIELQHQLYRSYVTDALERECSVAMLLKTHEHSDCELQFLRSSHGIEREELRAFYKFASTYQARLRIFAASVLPVDRITFFNDDTINLSSESPPGKYPASVAIRREFGANAFTCSQVSVYGETLKSCVTWVHDGLVAAGYTHAKIRQERCPDSENAPQVDGFPKLRDLLDAFRRKMYY